MRATIYGWEIVWPNPSGKAMSSYARLASASSTKMWRGISFITLSTASLTMPCSRRRSIMNIFGLNPVVVFGTDEQKQRWLPPLISGADKACFCVTEPNIGLNTTRLKTKAEKHGDHYIVSGQKIWISTAQVTNKMLLLARTAPLEQTGKPSQGLSLFYTDFDRQFVQAHEIPKMGRKAVDSNQVFIDGLKVPVADRIGEEGRGFEYILHGMH